MYAQSTNCGHAAVQHADWDANPAEMIIGHTYHNKVKPSTQCTAVYAKDAGLLAAWNIMNTAMSNFVSSHVVVEAGKVFWPMAHVLRRKEFAQCTALQQDL